jgi:hypothetical protein
MQTMLRAIRQGWRAKCIHAKSRQSKIGYRTGTAGQVQVEVLRDTTVINNQPPVPSAIKSAHSPLTLIAMITRNCLPLDLRIAS